MSRIISKKRALLTAAIASLALVAVAIAYYTTLGEGSGGGTTDNAYATNLVIKGDVPAGVVPGATVDLTNESVKNPITNPGDARVTIVKATDIDVGGDDEAQGGDPSGCVDSWFSIADVPVNTNLDPDESVTFDAQIAMQNPEGVDQNACKNKQISIEWDSGL